MTVLDGKKQYNLSILLSRLRCNAYVIASELLDLRMQHDSNLTPTLLANLLKYMPDSSEVCSSLSVHVSLPFLAVFVSFFRYLKKHLVQLKFPSLPACTCVKAQPFFYPLSFPCFTQFPRINSNTPACVY